MRPLSRRSWYALSLTLLLVLGQVTWALAGTTGSLSGTVLDQNRAAAVAGATIVANSPTQSAHATTDANGKFTFASLAPDTYTITVDKPGFETYTLSGVTIQADQTQTYSVTLAPKLARIGRVSSRLANDLVKPGTTIDVYSITPAQQAASVALGGGGALNSAYSAIASVPGVFVPQGQRGVYQSVFVRGGNYTQLGYEYDGVPIQRAFDAYPAQNLGTVGQQELQIYTGGSPVTSGSTGLAGYVNQVIKSGTYPGTGSLTAGAGSPFFYRDLGAEYGAATSNRRFSYYGGTNNYNQNFVYERGNEFSSQWGVGAYALAQNCATPQRTGGCYNIIPPNSWEKGPVLYGFNGLTQFTRESLVNLHLKVGSQTRPDDIQLLYNAQAIETTYPETMRDLGNLARDFMNGTATINGVTYPACTGALLAANTPCGQWEGAGAPPAYGAGFFYRDKNVYSGPVGTPLTAANLSQTRFNYFPNSPDGRAPNGLIDPNLRPSYQQDAAIVKLQYQRNLSDRSYLRVFGYTSYSDWLQFDPISPTIGGTALYGTISSDYKLGTHTRGAAVQFADQINDKHLLNVNLGYTTASTFRNNNTGGVTLSAATTAANTNTVAFLVNSADPTAGLCYRATGAGGVAVPVNCASATTSRYVLPGATTPAGALALAHATDPTVGNAGAFTCGGATCQYFTVANGQAAALNTVRPQFSTFAIQDTWTPSPRLTISFGLRYDDFKYILPDTTGGPARKFWTNYYNAYTCYDPQTTRVITGRAVANDCAAAGFQQFAFSPVSKSSLDYPELQPRIGATYTLNPLNVLRFSAGKSAQPANSSYQQYDSLAANLVPAANAIAFYSLGFRSPEHLVYPEESYSADASWEHQVQGSDVSWKLSPYFRQSKNEITTLVLDPITNFVSGVNAGAKFVKGIELAVRKGDFVRDGLSAQFSYTYTDAKIAFSKLGNGVTFVDPLNQAIKQYNAYTSFCASNAADPRCTTRVVGGAPVSLTTGGTIATPCFTQTGAPDPACGANSVANPYWNAPVQGLMDPGARYELYSRYSSSALLSGSNQSYVAPHTMALVAQYKRGKLAVTPSFQFQGGARYGRPLSTPGADPAAGCGTLTSPLAGDPRYPNGAPGGAPFNAATCGGFVSIPDPYAGRFDNYGQFREPNVILGNLGLTYDLSKRTKINLIGVNLLSSCWGGSPVPWRVSGRIGCNYGLQTGTYVGNLYNPGDRLDPVTQYPYTPTFTSGVLQQSTGGQAQYPQFFLTISHKL